MYKIVEREMTLDDFLALKKKMPFKENRADAKGINFGAIFGCSGPSLGVQLKGFGFDENKVNLTMKNLGLESAVNQQILSAQQKSLKNGKKVDPLAIKYSVVGTKFRELFFKTYPCLLKRTEREHAFAKKHGYVRSWVGPVRHLAELRFMKKNAEGEVVGADAVLYRSEFSHLCNDATNSPIQTAEVYQAMPDMTTFTNIFVECGLKSRLFNFVHDSGEFYIYKPERDLVYSIFTRVAAENRQPYFDIPMHIDVEESDPDLGETFREGREINIEDYDIKVELEKWNAKFPTKQIPLEKIEALIKTYIPIHGVLDGTRKVGVPYKPRRAKDGDVEILVG